MTLYDFRLIQSRPEKISVGALYLITFFLNCQIFAFLIGSIQAEPKHYNANAKWFQTQQVLDGLGSSIDIKQNQQFIILLIYYLLSYDDCSF